MEPKKPTKKVAKKAAVLKTTVSKTVEKEEKKPRISAKKATSLKPEKPASASLPKAESKPKASDKQQSREKKTEKIPEKKAAPAPASFQPAASQPEPPRQPAPEPNPWQDRYGDDRIVLLIRDPYWCFTYWDLSADKQAHIIREIRQSGAKIMLRVYDVTNITFDGTNAHRFMDIEVSEEATNWYLNVWAADCSYCVDLGLLYPDGRFVTLIRSNVVTTPRDSVSPVIDEEWMVVDETFDRLYQTAGASDVGKSSEAILKYMLKRVRADVTSGGFASMGSEGGRPRPAANEDFWLVVNTELIVYGATEPDAKVTIQGKPLPLNQDGTFSVRYALPDGKQVIDVHAVNAGGTQERTITPVVEKHTE